MFCNNCGTKVLDDAEFCHKCGARLIINYATTEPVGEGVWQTQVEPEPDKVPMDVPKKKKRKKWPVILGAAILLAVIIIIVVGLCYKPDYVGIVKEHDPYSDSLGMPYTFGEVFGKYLSNATYWVDTEDKETNTAIVKVDGILKGRNERLTLNIEVSEKPNNHGIFSMSAESGTLDGEKLSSDDAYTFIYYMFLAYDEGYKDLSELVSDSETTATDPSAENNLSDDGFMWVEDPMWTNDGYLGHITGVIKNTSGDMYSSATISFNLYDSSGNQVGTAIDYISDLEAGGTWKFDAIIYEENVSGYKFSSLQFY